MRERNIAVLGCALGAALLFYMVVRDGAFRTVFPRVPPRTLPAEIPPPPLTALMWSEVPFVRAPWEARDSHAVTVFKDAVWLMGGLNGNGLVTRDKYGEHVEYWRAPHFSDVWKSTDGYNWELATKSAPWGKRRSAQAAEFKGRVWLMGGWGPVIGYRSDVWASADGSDWERVTARAAWPAREGHTLVVWRDKLWLIGGVRYDTRKTFNDVWSSTDGSHWELATDNPPWLSRWDHAVAAFRDRLYLTAGMDLRGNTFDDVWSSTDGSHWELAIDNPPWRERQGHVLLEYRGALWSVGRLNDRDSGNGPNDVWFTEDGIMWKKTDVNPPWLGREDHGAVVFHDRMWITGGMDSNWQWGNDVWYSVLGR